MLSHEGVPKPRSVLFTLLPHRLGINALAQPPMFVANLDVRTFPPTGDRRQVVGGGHCNVRIAPSPWRHKAGLVIPLKPQDTHAVNAALLQYIVEAWRHRS